MERAASTNALPNAFLSSYIVDQSIIATLANQSREPQSASSREMDGAIDFLCRDAWMNKIPISQALPYIVNNFLPELKSRPLRVIKKIGQIGHTLDNLNFAIAQVDPANTSDPLTQDLYQILEALLKFDDFLVVCQEDGRLSDALLLALLKNPEALPSSLLRLIDWDSLREPSLMNVVWDALLKRGRLDYYYPLFMNDKLLGDEGSCRRTSFMQGLLTCIANLTTANEVAQLDLLNAWCCLLAASPKNKLFTKDAVDALTRLSLSALRSSSFEKQHVAGLLLGELALERHTRSHVGGWVEGGLHNKLAHMIDALDICLNCIILNCLKRVIRGGLVRARENAFDPQALGNILRSANSVGREALLAITILVNLQELEKSQEVSRAIRAELGALCTESNSRQVGSYLRLKSGSLKNEPEFELFRAPNGERKVDLRHQCLLARMVSTRVELAAEKALCVREAQRALEDYIELLAGQLESARMSRERLEVDLNSLRDQLTQLAAERQESLREQDILRVTNHCLQERLTAADDEIAQLRENVMRVGEEKSTELIDAVAKLKQQFECERTDMMVMVEDYRREKNAMADELCIIQSDNMAKTQQLEILIGQHGESANRSKQLEELLYEAKRQASLERIRLTQAISESEDNVAVLQQQLSECHSQLAISKIQESHLANQYEQAKQIIQQKDNVISRLQHELQSLLSPPSQSIDHALLPPPTNVILEESSSSPPYADIFTSDDPLHKEEHVNAESIMAKMENET